MIRVHVFIKHSPKYILAHIYTLMHSQIYSHNIAISSGTFISMGITNLTTVALNLHVNDDYFGCFRLFLQIRAFILFQSRLLLYIIYVWAYLRYVRFLPCKLQKPCHFFDPFCDLMLYIETTKMISF